MFWQFYDSGEQISFEINATEYQKAASSYGYTVKDYSVGQVD